MSGAMREERKVVTALFADVVGSTELTERLDPEDAREVLGACVGRMVEAVEAFGGTVKDLAGDGILALFGAPVTHEDDAERAIRAGLRIAGATEEEPEHPVLVRVGIETGLVVLGPVGGGGRVEYGATGDALNTAARLQAHAPPGTVLVGEVTRRAVGERFAFGQERELELKGKSQPVTAFGVLGERRRAAMAASTPMVGREPEFERASRLAERALGGEGGLLVAVGEPGIGKSRLVEEVHVSRDAVTWLEGRCVSYGASTPYMPLREVIHDAIGVPSGEPVSGPVLRRQVRAIDGSLDDAVPYLAAVLGTGDGEAMRDLSPETRRLRTLGAIRRLVIALAERGPTVVCVEDLHWADASTVHTLERLVPVCEGRPLLFVLTVRHHDAIAGALATSPPGRTEVIELSALPTEGVDELVAALLEGGTIPPGLLGRITETAGGNPFFLSELIRSLLASGELEPDAACEARTIELPTTIEKVILARLDRLDPSQRDVLTSASVLGRTVALPLLERLLGADPRAEADDLVRLQLFERDGRPDEVWFAHALIQEVAYGSLLRRRRRELHGTAAAAIEELWPDRLEENLAILAHHHRGAGDLMAAMRCHDLAADRADRVHAGEEALEHLTASIEISRELGMAAGQEVAERFLVRARVRARTGDAAGARNDLETVLAEPGIAPDLVMRAHDELGFVLAGAADYRAAVPHLEAALGAASALGDATGQVSALSRLSIVSTNRLDFDAALEHGERALRSAAGAGDERAEAVAMDALKQVALETGDVDTLERLAERLAEIHRRNDDLWLLQFPVFEVGYADLARMRLGRAFAAFEDALAINRRIGDVGNEPLFVAMLGRAHRGRGEYNEALALGRRAFDLANELGHGEWTAWTAACLGSTLMELGALDQASPLLAVGAQAAERSAADLHLVRLLGMGAWAAQELGEDARALELADRATAILDRIRVRAPRAYVAGQDAYVAVARVRLAQGRPEVAAQLVAPIVTACRACGWSDGVVDGSLVLTGAALHRGETDAAVEAATIALTEALRVGSPTLWRCCRGAADAFRARGDEGRAVEYATEADRAVAHLSGRIHDRAIRDALLSAASSGRPWEGVER